MFRGIMDCMGYRKAYVEFKAAAREQGEAGYSYRRLLALALGSMTSFSLLALKLSGYLGLVIAAVSALPLLWMTIDHFCLNYFGFTALALIVVANTFLIGVVLMAIGRVALYIGTIHTEVINSPLFLMREEVGISSRDDQLSFGSQRSNLIKIFSAPFSNMSSGALVVRLRRGIMELLMGKVARASLWLVAANVVGGIFGYAYQVVMGRMLTPVEYGLFGAAIAVISLLSAPLSTLMMILSRRVSEYRAVDNFDVLKRSYFSVNLRVAIVALIGIAVLTLFHSELADYLKAPSSAVVYVLAGVVLISVFPVINNAYLQGLQNFKWFALSGGVAHPLRLIFSAALIAMGLGVEGALAGIAVSLLVAWMITYVPLRAQLSHATGSIADVHRMDFSWRSAVPVLIANVAFTAMTQLDMVLVNHYFPPVEAGLYAAASVLGKAVMYLPAGIALALFPLIAEKHARDESGAALFVQAVVLTAGLCLIGALFYLIWGREIVALFYGQAYVEAGEVLRYFGFAMLPMALVMVAEYFLIAKGKVMFAYLFMIAAPVEVLAIAYFHDSLLQVVLVLGIGGAAMTLVGYGLLLNTYRRG